MKLGLCKQSNYSIIIKQYKSFKYKVVNDLEMALEKDLQSGRHNIKFQLLEI